ncbi:MAG: hypothetical protein K2J30_05695, partial [Clostridia bacterium]|nr:hypothetical protein [Clostridia bacterium]
LSICFPKKLSILAKLVYFFQNKKKNAAQIIDLILRLKFRSFETVFAIAPLLCETQKPPKNNPPNFALKFGGRFILTIIIFFSLTASVCGERERSPRFGRFPVPQA